MNNNHKMSSNINTINNNDLGNGYPNGMPQIDCKDKMKEIWNSFPLLNLLLFLPFFFIFLISSFLSLGSI